MNTYRGYSTANGGMFVLMNAVRESLERRGFGIGCTREQVAYVLAHGQPYEGSPRPKGQRQRAARSCFRTATSYVLSHPDHLYCEGFGSSEFGPIHHAWVLSPGGTVIDLVWPDPENQSYFGVPFTIKEMADRLFDGREVLS